MSLEKINLINKYLSKQLWMDFEICNMNGAKVEVYGYLDEAGEDKIKITFDKPHMIISTFVFTYEGNGEFISLVTGEEAIEMNKKYQVTRGNQIFKMSNTNIDTDMFIIAKEIYVEILE